MQKQHSDFIIKALFWSIFLLSQAQQDERTALHFCVVCCLLQDESGSAPLSPSKAFVYIEFS